MRYLLAASALVVVNLVVSLYVASRTDAGSALQLDLRALVERSELIVEGRVLAARALEEGDLLLTEYLLEVSRTLKGPDLSYRAIRFPGGVREDGSGLLVPGVPRLIPGEATLLFLGPEGRAGLRMPTGLAQGSFALRADASGRKQLASDARTLGLLGPDGGGFHPGVRGVLDYADLVAAVEVAANASEER